MLGKFIVFEGIDGSGKSTLAKDYTLRCNGIYTSEPTEGHIGKEIRNILTNHLPSDNIHTMFYNDRVEHVNQIKQWLNEGKNVVCDRYMYSNFVYQFENYEELLELHKDILVPDYVIYCYCNPEIAYSRICGRVKKDMYEDKLSLLNNLGRYNVVLQNVPNVILVNTADSVENCMQLIVEGVK